MRRNIELKYSNGKKVYFYSHWTGETLDLTLRDALEKGRERWSDESYLARIIFSEMIKDEVNKNTGYGISPYETSANYPTIKIDLKEQTVNDKNYQDFINEKIYQDFTKEL